MDRLGLSYEEAKAINPKLIYCSINSFGDKGPLSEKPGMDLVVQAMGGVMGITGLEGGQPVRVGAPVADYVGALQTMTTVLLALNERHRSGKGQRVNVILLDGQIAMLSNYIAGFFVSGRPSGPVGIFHPQIVPYQPYDAKDRQVIVACLTEQFWQRMCQALDLEFLLDDARFDLVADRVAHREELNGILKPVFAAMTSAELIQRLEEADVPCCPINSISDIVDHPQVKANGTILELEYDGGSHHAVKAPFGLSRTPPRKPTAGPALGEHTEEILNEIGLSSADL
jgi:crotonobetainyl-CoA:carnitine CoA-transferase CaiB-like acyl-CoA transferase